MTDKDSAALGLESLKAFQDAKNNLLQALSEVEETITRNLETKAAIVGALGDIGVTVPPAPEPQADPEPEPEKKPSRRGKKAAAAAPAAAAVVEPVVEPEVEAVADPVEDAPADVVDHLPSSETQDEVTHEAEAKGEDAEEALDDWTPGDSANSDGSDSYSALDFDEIQF